MTDKHDEIIIVLTARSDPTLTASEMRDALLSTVEEHGYKTGTWGEGWRMRATLSAVRDHMATPSLGEIVQRWADGTGALFIHEVLAAAARGERHPSVESWGYEMIHLWAAIMQMSTREFCIRAIEHLADER